jgi:hypothetical protein
MSFKTTDKDLKVGDLVKWHKDWSPDTEKLDACKIGVAYKKGKNNLTEQPIWWVYFPPHRMVLYEEDLEKVNVVQDN